MAKITNLLVISFFILNSIGPIPAAQADNILNLPTPGTMVTVSPSFDPALIKGLTVHRDNPFLFDFIVDPADSHLSGQALKDESDRMIKYFFAALTIPDKDVWVNLSPYEKDRMIPQSLGETAMGRDLLAQDYMLKQLTASLIYPQSALGKTFWDTVYSQAKQKYGTTQIPVNTFNKVWIVPQEVKIYEHGQTAFILSGHLKVMLEEDYLSLTKHNAVSVIARSEATKQSFNDTHKIGSQVIRQIVLPEIEREVNNDKNFSTLRQIFYAQSLAVWFKRNLKEALLNRAYANKSTVKGIDQNDEATNEAIFRQYLRAYKKGVFNFIKEDIDPVTQESLPRKYFSGGYYGAGERQNIVTSEAAMTAADRSAAMRSFTLAVAALPLGLSLLGATLPGVAAAQNIKAPAKPTTIRLPLSSSPTNKGYYVVIYPDGSIDMEISFASGSAPSELRFSAKTKMITWPTSDVRDLNNTPTVAEEKQAKSNIDEGLHALKEYTPKDIPTINFALSKLDSPANQIISSSIAGAQVGQALVQVPVVAQINRFDYSFPDQNGNPNVTMSFDGKEFSYTQEFGNSRVGAAFYSRMDGGIGMERNRLYHTLVIDFSKNNPSVHHFGKDTSIDSLTPRAFDYYIMAKSTTFWQSDVKGLAQAIETQVQQARKANAFNDPQKLANLQAVESHLLAVVAPGSITEENPFQTGDFPPAVEVQPTIDHNGFEVYGNGLNEVYVNGLYASNSSEGYTVNLGSKDIDFHTGPTAQHYVHGTDQWKAQVIAVDTTILGYEKAHPEKKAGLEVYRKGLAIVFSRKDKAMSAKSLLALGLVLTSPLATAQVDYQSAAKKLLSLSLKGGATTYIHVPYEDYTVKGNNNSLLIIRDGVEAEAVQFHHDTKGNKTATMQHLYVEFDGTISSNDATSKQDIVSELSQVIVHLPSDKGRAELRTYIRTVSASKSVDGISTRLDLPAIQVPGYAFFADEDVVHLVKLNSSGPSTGTVFDTDLNALFPYSQNMRIEDEKINTIDPNALKVAYATINAAEEAYPALIGDIDKYATYLRKKAKQVEITQAPAEDRRNQGFQSRFRQGSEDSGYQEPQASLQPENGGIDLSQTKDALRVSRDANGGVRIDVNPLFEARVEREGIKEVDPIIIGMKPTDVQVLVGPVTQVS